MSVWSNGKSTLLCFGAVVLMTGVAAAIGNRLSVRAVSTTNTSRAQ